MGAKEMETAGDSKSMDGQGREMGGIGKWRRGTEVRRGARG